MGFKILQKGDHAKTKRFLRELSRKKFYDDVLNHYGNEGVLALASATPVDSGKTSESWDYKIEHGAGYTRIVWTNSSQTYQGDSIAILLQYGHGTGTGGYVVGRDYINPAIIPIFDDILDKIWEAVKNL